LNVLGITTTPSIAAAPLVSDVPAQQSTAAHWGRGDSVTQSSFSGTLTPEVEFRRPVPVAPVPLEPGAMTALDPYAPVASTSQQENRSTSRRSVPAGPKAPDPLVPAASPVAGGSATPGTTTSGVSSMGGGTDRVLARREPFMPGWNGGDAVEPVQQTQRRRDRQDEKITERVDGADAEVPPAVIGTEPYRQ
jgi:hypothetical protein